MKRTLKKATALLLVMLMSLSSAFMSFAEMEEATPESLETVVKAAEEVEVINTEEMVEVAEAVEAVEAAETDTKEFLENEVDTVNDNDTGTDLVEHNDIVLLSNGTGVTIHYDANGGEGEMLDDVVSVGSQYTIKSCSFTKSEHELMFWVETSSVKRKVLYPGDTITIEVDQPIMLKAFWVCSGGGWRKDEEKGNYQYLNKDGYVQTNDWAKDGIHFYYLGEDGYLQANTYFDYGDDTYCTGFDYAIITNNWVSLDDIEPKQLAYAGYDGSFIKSRSVKINSVLYSFDENGYVTGDLALVTFDSNGGDFISPQIIKKGTIPEKPADPFYQGHVFAGWYDSDFSEEYKFDEPIQTNVTLKALWLDVGWRKTDDWCYLKANGQFIFNDWHSSSNKLFYLGDDGYITHNATVTYAGKTYQTDAGGALIIDSEDAKKLYLEKWVDCIEGNYAVEFDFLDENQMRVSSLDAPMLATYACGVKSRELAKNRWVWYPAERLSDTKYEKFGLVFFWFGANGKKVTDQVRVIGGQSYTFDSNGVCLEGCLTFYANDGTDTCRQVMYDIGDWVNLADYAFSRQGYVFSGFDRTADGSGRGYEVNDMIRPWDNITFYAQWKAISTVTFDANGHGTAPSSQTVKEGDKITRPVDPSASSYSFGGWYKEKTCINAWDFDSDLMPGEDITLYAKWTEDTSSGNDGSSGDSSGGSSGGSSKSSSGGFGGGGGGGGGAKGGGPGTAAAGAPTFSKNWVADAAGVWRIKDKTGNYVTSAWLCDDAVTTNGQNVWYLMNTDGTMLAAGLVQDNTGNFYSLEMNHNGYYGMLRYVNGTYDGIYMEFSQKHDGTFGAITNQSAIDALKAKYGVTRFGIGNDRCMYSKTFE